MKLLINVRYYFVLFLICHLVNDLSAQIETVHDHIVKIESSSDFIFNYNVSVADSLEVNFDWKGDYTEEKIDSFLSLTPYDYHLNGNKYLLLPLKKETYKVGAFIVSRENNEPIIGALIYTESGFSVQTNEEGYFEFVKKAYKNETFTVSYLGYEPMTVSIKELAKLSKVKLKADFNLFGHDIVIRDFIEEGIVEGTSFGSISLNMDKRSLNSSVNNIDVQTHIQKLPGVSSADDSSSNINIRGSSVDQNLLLWEGVTLYDNGHLFGMISSINPVALSEVKVYKGVHSSSFDNRIGGVVEFKLPSQYNELSTDIMLNLTDAGVSLQLPIKENKVGVFMSYRNSLFGVLGNTPTINGFTEKLFNSFLTYEDTEDDNELIQEESSESEISFGYSDLNSKFIYNMNDRINIESSVYLSSNDYDYTSLFPMADYIIQDETKNKSFANNTKIGFKHSLNFKSEMAIGYSEYKSDLNSEFSNVEDVNDVYTRIRSNKVNDLQLKFSQQLNFKNAVLNYGYIYDSKTVSYLINEESLFDQPFEEFFNNKGMFHHLYFDYSIQENKILFQVGARNTYSLLNQKLNSSPRLNFRYEILNGFYAKASGGLFNQYIRQLYDIDNSDIFVSDNIWFIDSDPESEVLRSKKVSSGFVYKRNGLLFDFEGYYIKSNGISAENPNVNNSFGIDDMGEISSRGVDLILQRQFHNTSIGVFYSLSSNRFYFPSLSEIDEKEFFNSNIDQTHILGFLFDYKVNNIDFNLSYKYKSGLPFSNPDGIEMDEEEEDDFELLYEDINNSRLRDYHRIDFSAGIDENFGPYNLSCRLVILNVFNTSNVYNKGFQLANLDEIDDDPEILEIDRFLLPRTLQLQLHFHF